MSDAWAIGGATALQRFAPTAAAALTGLVSVWPKGVSEEQLAAIRAVTAEGLGLTPLRRPPAGPRRERLRPAPDVMPFAEQFAVDVSVIDHDLLSQWHRVVGHVLGDATLAVWVADAVPRGRAALTAIFGDDAWYDVALEPTRHARIVMDEFLREVVLLEVLDPVTRELVRLRVARQLTSRVAMSRRSLDAMDAGADAGTFEAVDRYRSSGLPERQQAALALADAMTWTPADLRARDVDLVREHLTPPEAVAVVLDVMACSADKIAVALGTDDPEVEGLQLFQVGPDGDLVFP